MATIEQLTLRDMFRTAPVRSALCTILPVLIAVLQLANSVVNDVSFFVSVPFALVIVSYAYFVTQFTFAKFQRQQVERTLWH